VERDKILTLEVKHGKILILKEGYGYIKPDSVGENIFFHRSGLLNSSFDELHQGVAVEFVIRMSEKGQLATQIIVLGGATGSGGDGPDSSPKV
jgi:cold shock CspA family protein